MADDATARALVRVGDGFERRPRPLNEAIVVAVDACEDGRSAPGREALHRLVDRH